MPDNSQTPKFYLLFSVAGVVAGIAVCVLGQQLNGKIYEFSGVAAPHFQDAFGQISFSMLVLGGLIFSASVMSVFLSLGAKGSGDKKAALHADLLRVLRDCGFENEADPLQSLQTAINQLRLDLVESRKRERSIVEKAVDVICVLDLHAKFLTVSRACQHAWGYSPQELENHPLSDILVGENSTNILNSILGSANSIDKIIFECKLKKKDGRLIDVLWTAHWSASDGGLFCIVHDITERKYAEKLLKSSESRLRKTLESLPVGVLMVDRHGIIEFANTEAARMVFRSPKELVGSAMATHITSGERRIGEELQDQMTDSILMRVMATATRKDGSTFPVDLSESFIELADEQKTIAVFIDKTAEQELERVKREFVAWVTHEIRTPISSVYGILALMESGALGEMTEKGKRLAGSVKVTCKRVISLITDLLDLEKMQAGKFALECKQVSVRYAMESAFDNVVSLSSERNITIDLPHTELCCWADVDRLVQVMINLMSNAIKYSPDASTITLGIEELENSMLKILVTDRGRGIPDDKLKKVFSQFEQVELADAKKKGGTGLGLAICQAIVAEHGGEIGVVSKLGEGSCFWFTIPMNPKDQPAVPEPTTTT
jgi:PAS domain S-box-containing protein